MGEGNDESLVKKIVYEYRMFVDYIEPKGALTLDKACHACFYYTMLATKARLNAGAIETQMIQYKVGEEAPLWREPRDEEIAISIALMYGLESPDEFLKFKKEAWTQAQHFLGVEVPLEIYNVRPGGAKRIQ